MGFPLWICALTAIQSSQDVVLGNVRVQVLSASLVRIEQKGPKGFVDGNTFNVVGRDWSRPEVSSISDWHRTQVKFGDVSVDIFHSGQSVEGDTVSLGGTIVYTAHAGRPPAQSFFPGPASKDPVYVMADWPRIIPPPWGATPPPQGSANASSGWDLSDDAPDIYVFINRPGGYQKMRRDFLHLTGPTPIPPLFAFGFIDSRYYPYTEQEALDSIDTYRSKGIPLDMFVVDTDWRVNGSHGYKPEAKYFPDMPRFLKEAHQRDVRIMFNDHPEPQAETALDPREFQYRWEGLTKLMGEGVDVWWYDRNWGVSLKSPESGLRHEVWGQRVYHDITATYRPEQRPMIMTNVDGIDGGFRQYAPYPASHRWPIWWTGDTPAVMASLQRGVKNAVDEGVIGFLPYVNEDLGGHFDTPDAETYTRFLEYGCLCPITRVHCTRGQDRHPWAFGPETEKIVTDYIKLRYRLLPTIYSAAHRAFEDGTPLLRRLDLEYPQFPEASDDTQYLLGDDLLVAPIIRSMHGDSGPIDKGLLHTPDGRIGLRGEYFSNQNLQGQSALVRTDSTIGFDWGDGSPDKSIPNTHFSARWTGTLGPMPESGDYELSSVSDDGIRVFVEGKPVIDEWHDSDSQAHSGKVHLEKGKSYRLRVEFFQNEGGSNCTVSLKLPSDANRKQAERTVWIPPGEWQDAWTGGRLNGPKTIHVSADIRHMPMYIRDGGIIATTEVAQHTSAAYWRSLKLDAYIPSADGTVTRRLVEDDGSSNGYMKGDQAVTTMSLRRTGNRFMLAVAAPSGKQRLAVRHITVRLHLPKGLALNGVSIGGPPDSKLKELLPDASADTRLPLQGQGSIRSGEGKGVEIQFDLGADASFGVGGSVRAIR